MKTENIEVVFSVDTTGSMYPCLMQVRKKVETLVNRLFDDISNIKIGIIAHGDYCDTDTYVTKTLDLTDDRQKICSFIHNVGRTFGGDAPECYELVLHEARGLSWTSGKSKVLVMIGDDVPHESNYYLNKKKLDWRNELGLLLESQVHVYGVQCLNRHHATFFYEEIAKRTGGFHISLDQFSNINEIITAICYKQECDIKLQDYEGELEKIGKLNRNLDRTFNKLLGRAEELVRYGESELKVVVPGRFQTMDVDNDCSIREFVEDNGLSFKTGRGFYQFTKTVTVQRNKEVILMHKITGDLFSGEEARKILGLPPKGTECRAKPPRSGEYIGFIQSTSYNRKLLGNTKFLYEVEDYS